MSTPELHPVVVALCGRMACSDGIYEIPEEQRVLLDRDLAALFRQPALRDAVRDLLRLACWLDTEARSPRAAQAILDALEAITPEMRALEALEAEADGGAAETPKFERFRDPDARAVAPRLGESAPKGTLKIGSLDYPKRG